MEHHIQPLPCQRSTLETSNVDGIVGETLDVMVGEEKEEEEEDEEEEEGACVAVPMREDF